MRIAAWNCNQGGRRRLAPFVEVYRPHVAVVRGLSDLCPLVVDLDWTAAARRA